MNMVRLVGRWFGDEMRYLGFRPKYRHVNIKRVLSKPYMEDGLKWQYVLVTVYGYENAGVKFVAYVSETSYYSPTHPLYEVVGKYLFEYDLVRISSDGVELTAISDPKHRVAITERFGRD